MRYESFYPFARQQPSPPPTGHSGFGLPPQMGQRQAPRQPFPNGPMNNPFGGPGPGQNPQQSPSKMDTYMQTANRFLNTAQQFAPVVQQFAPMIQNLPAMWRLYKGFQSSPQLTEGQLPEERLTPHRLHDLQDQLHPPAYLYHESSSRLTNNFESYARLSYNGVRSY